MKRLLLCLSLMASSAANAVEPPASDAMWHRVVGLLQYLEGDYPAAMASANGSELSEQAGFADEAVQALAPAEGAPYRARAESIKAAIQSRADPVAVSTRCQELSRAIISEQQLVQSPREPPDLVAGARLFASTCSSCHGERGDGQSAVAAAMSPKPANFHDAELMSTLTPYKVFNTTTFGIKGTLMQPFSSLSDAERWNVSFFIFTLRQKECAQASTFKNPATLQQLATLTDGELLSATALGSETLPCLRRVSPKADLRSSLTAAMSGVQHAQALSVQGQHDQARQAIVDAYLTGVEPIEPILRARDPALVAQLEAAFAKARISAQNHEDLAEDAGSLVAVLQRAANQKGARDFWSVFITALFILLREGFEVVVVVGALLAVLKKMGATSQARVVHFGWVSALIFSVIVYAFGQHLLAGANREWMETVVSLAAVFMLLYAALWLNARANMSKFMTEMREKMKGAIGSGNMFGLFLISFTSVGRETLETALFIEGLAGDSPKGAAWGAAAGIAVLAAFLAFIRRAGFALPMKTLFKASTVLLVATAVIMTGKGIHGLQELGVLPLASAPFFTAGALGIYADSVSLLPQLVLAVAPLAWWALHKRRPRVLESAPTR